MNPDSAVRVMPVEPLPTDRALRVAMQEGGVGVYLCSGTDIAGVRWHWYERRTPHPSDLPGVERYGWAAQQTVTYVLWQQGAVVSRQHVVAPAPNEAIPTLDLVAWCGGVDSTIIITTHGCMGCDDHPEMITVRFTFDAHLCRVSNDERQFGPWLIPIDGILPKVVFSEVSETPTRFYNAPLIDARGIASASFYAGEATWRAWDFFSNFGLFRLPDASHVVIHYPASKHTRGG